MKILEDKTKNVLGNAQLILTSVILRYYIFYLSLYHRNPTFNDPPWADPEGGTGGPDPPWNFGKNVLIGFVKWYWFDIAQHLCKIQS